MPADSRIMLVDANREARGIYPGDGVLHGFSSLTIRMPLDVGSLHNQQY